MYAQSVLIRRFILLLISASFLLHACRTLEVSVERTATPGDGARSTAEATLIEVVLDTLRPIGSPTSEAALATAPLPTPTSKGVELPGSLYFLSTGPTVGNPRGVWRLDPGDTELERVTPPDLDITSFDVWLGDGRMAYGTGSGQLYVVMPEQEPRLLYDAGLRADGAVEINSMAWSPEGTRLAYSLRYSNANVRATGQADGLWLVTLNDGEPIKLLNNRHLDADQLDVNAVRSISDPIWSPDGTALLLTGHYWEWIDVLWLDPLAPDEANLHDLPDELWRTGSWAKDSRSILLSGANYAAFSDLVRVRRDSNESERLIAGETEGLYIYKARELPDGIAFLAFQVDSQETQLYLGRQTDDGFSYAPAGPDRYLCDSGHTRDIAWEPTGRLAVLSCSRGAQLVSLDGSIDVDLTSILGPLAGENDLKVFWGPSRESD